MKSEVEEACCGMPVVECGVPDGIGVWCACERNEARRCDGRQPALPEGLHALAAGGLFGPISWIAVMFFPCVAGDRPCAEFE